MNEQLRGVVAFSYLEENLQDSNEVDKLVLTVAMQSSAGHHRYFQNKELGPLPKVHIWAFFIKSSEKI